MDDSTRISLNEQFFAEYRRKLDRIEELQSELKAREADIAKLRAQIPNELTELASMRTVITRIIEHGIDPVMAKLGDPELRKRDIWYDRFYDSEYSSAVLNPTHTSAGGGGGGGAGGFITVKI